MGLNILLAAAGQGQGDDMVRAGSALLLFVVLTILMGAFIVIVGLLIIARHRRRKQQPEAPAHPMLDPWSESARRVQPYDQSE